MRDAFGSDIPSEALEDATAGAGKQSVWGHGIGMTVHRNVSGALFITVGPIHGPDSNGRAEQMIAAIAETQR